MSSFFLKILALFFMIIDHTGLILFPDQIIFRAIGRLALPLFAFQMAVGFSHTKNKKKHILKLLIFAIMCQFPYMLMLNLYNIPLTLNILFTFILSLCVIYLLEALKFDKKALTSKQIFKNFILLSLSIFLIWLGNHLNVDYGWYGILLTVLFYFTLNKKWLSVILFAILVHLNFISNPTAMHALVYISIFDIIFILSFNGKKGYNNSLIFYLLYFLHFFPLLLIKHFFFI